MKLFSRLIHVAAIIVTLLTIVAVPSAAIASQFLTIDQAFSLKTQRRADGDLIIRWTIADGHYLYRDHTTVQHNGQSLAATLSPGVKKDDPGFGPVSVWLDRGEVVISAQTLARAGEPARLDVTYQGCQDGSICFPPVTQTVAVPALVASSSAPIPAPAPAAKAERKIPEAQTATPLIADTTVAQASASPSTVIAPTEATTIVPQVIPDAGPETVIDRLEKQGGQAWVLAAFFGFGLLLAFTPCVFPMYPILAGIIGQEASGTRRGLWLSVAYVLGLATAFGVLGLAAAWSGHNLQMALQSPWAIGILSAIFVVLAASMFGGFDLSLPQAWTSRFQKAEKTGQRALHSAAGMGFASALIVGPCVTAPLAGALLYIAQTGDALLGAAALFSLGLGKGVPLVMFGTAGARYLPRAGRWMNHVKMVFGFVFLIMAWWLASRVLAPQTVMLTGAAIALTVAAALMRLIKSPQPVLSIACSALAALSGFWGLFLLAGLAMGTSDPWRPLMALQSREAVSTATSPLAATVSDQATLSAALQKASERSRPAVLYFTADWCVTCRAIERDVLPAPLVAQALSEADLIKVDVTSNSSEIRTIMAQYGIIGPPTMVFMDVRGSELATLRLVGTITTEGLLKGLKEAEGAS